MYIYTYVCVETVVWNKQLTRKPCVGAKEKCSLNLNLFLPQKMFEDGSQVLFEATRKRAFFRKVTIVVPPSWDKREDYLVREARIVCEGDVSDCTLA